MPNVRKTPKRRRATCPACGRDVAYTVPYVRFDDHSVFAMLAREQKNFVRHNTPEGEPCRGEAHPLE